METVESEVQDHIWLLSGFEDSISYIRLSQKEWGGGEKEEEEKGGGGAATAKSFGSGRSILF